jgi:hypothetical protein
MLLYILEFVLRWLSPDSQLKLYDLDAAEPDVNEYNHLPDTEAGAYTRPLIGST